MNETYTKEYYEIRPLEHKHFIECLLYLDYFEPKKILDVGCGNGHRVFTMVNYESDAYGIDIEPAIFTSPYLNESNPYYELMKNRLKASSITHIPFDDREFDLVIAYDVLEHLTFEQLELALKEISRVSNKYVLFSIPFLGDPNLERDPTHKIFRTKQWWISEIQRYFRIEETPSHFLFKHQLLVGEKWKNL